MYAMVSAIGRIYIYIISNQVKFIDHKRSYLCADALLVGVSLGWDIANTIKKQQTEQVQQYNLKRKKENRSFEMYKNIQNRENGTNFPIKYKMQQLLTEL